MDKLTNQLNKNVIEYGDYKSCDVCTNFYEFKQLMQYKTIFKGYNLNEIAGCGDTFSKALNIMQWIDNNTIYDGNSPLRPTTSDKIIEFSFGRSSEGAINCANKAILLSDALMSINIFSLPIAMLNRIINPDSKYFMFAHSHVVTHIFLPELHKWIVLDPSFNTYLVDKHNSPLNIIEISTAIKRGEKIHTVLNNKRRKLKYGLQCVINGLVDLYIWRGNDYSYRTGDFGWDSAYHLLSDKYVDKVKSILNEITISEQDIQYLKNDISHETIYTNELLAIPKMIYV